MDNTMQEQLTQKVETYVLDFLSQTKKNIQRVTLEKLVRKTDPYLIGMLTTTFTPDQCVDFIFTMHWGTSAQTRCGDLTADVRNDLLNMTNRGTGCTGRLDFINSMTDGQHKSSPNWANTSSAEMLEYDFAKSDRPNKVVTTSYGRGVSVNKKSGVVTYKGQLGWEYCSGESEMYLTVQKAISDALAKHPELAEELTKLKEAKLEALRTEFKKEFVNADGSVNCTKLTKIASLATPKVRKIRFDDEVLGQAIDSVYDTYQVDTLTKAQLRHYVAVKLNVKLSAVSAAVDSFIKRNMGTRFTIKWGKGGGVSRVKKSQ